MNGLLLTLALGIFIVVGAIIVFLTKNNDMFVEFSISLAFGVMVTLVFTHILPEAIEVVKVGKIWQNVLLIIGGACLGYFALFFLDHFIPDHDDDYNTQDDDNNNLKHIGLVSSIALVIHNIVEGMAIYALYLSDSTSGLMASIGVGLHNIPLGMVIASTFYKANNSKKRTSLIILGIALSTFVGGFIMYSFDLGSIIELVEAIVLTITLGMLIYISVKELFPKVVHSKYKKTSGVGVVLGVLTLLLTLLF